VAEETGKEIFKKAINKKCEIKKVHILSYIQSKSAKEQRPQGKL
jgi:hypothetical protein